MKFFGILLLSTVLGSEPLTLGIKRIVSTPNDLNTKEFDDDFISTTNLIDANITAKYDSNSVYLIKLTIGKGQEVQLNLDGTYPDIWVNKLNLKTDPTIIKLEEPPVLFEYRTGFTVLTDIYKAVVSLTGIESTRLNIGITTSDVLDSKISQGTFGIAFQNRANILSPNNLLQAFGYDSLGMYLPNYYGLDSFDEIGGLTLGGINSKYVKEDFKSFEVTKSGIDYELWSFSTNDISVAVPNSKL
ncbi:hypothetical protein BC833DRAFT_627878, partial [Globomyces pollinis-pini]